MVMYVRNKNYNSPRKINLKSGGEAIKNYFLDNPNTEILTVTELLSAIPALNGLKPLEECEIHFMCDIAEVEFIRN